VRGKQLTRADFRGGLNSESNFALGANQARDLSNVQGTIGGAIVKRGGMQAFAAPAAEPKSLGIFKAASGSYKLVGSTGSSSFFEVSSAGTVTTHSGLVTSGGFFESTLVPESAQGPLIIATGANQVGAWTGTGNVTAFASDPAGGVLTAADTPSVDHVTWHANRLWLAKTYATLEGSYGTLPDPASALMWSEIGAPYTLPTANVVVFDPLDGDSIMGLGKHGPYLVVLKRHKTFIVYDTDTGANRRISDSIGCCARRTVVETPHGLVFLSDQGVYRLGGETLTRISDPIQTLLNAIPASLRSLCSATYFDDHYYLSIGASGSSDFDITLDYDFKLGSWWKHTVGANQWASLPFSSTSELFAACSDASAIRKAFVAGVYQDNAANFTVSWKAPFEAMGAPHLRKRLRSLTVEGVGSPTIKLATNFDHNASDETSLGSVTLGTTTTGPAQQTLNSLGVARSFSPVVSHAANEAFELDAYTLMWQPRRA
jgi:hypothetical protein